MSPKVEDTFNYLCFKYFSTYSLLKRQPCARLHDSSATAKESSYFEPCFWYEKKTQQLNQAIMRKFGDNLVF